MMNIGNFGASFASFSALNRKLSFLSRISILILLLLPLTSCGHLGARRELQRNRIFVEILKREDLRSPGNDDFFEYNLLVNPDLQVRQWSAVALGRIGSPRALPLLYRALHTGDADIRAASAFAIGQIENRAFLREQFRDLDPKAISELCSLLDDPSLRVRMRVTEALGKMGSHEEAVAIANRLEGFTYSGEATEQAYLEYAITALVRLKDSAAAPVLERFAIERDPEIRGRALDALARLRIKSAGPLFISNLESPYMDVQAAAVRGVGIAEDPSAAELLLPLLPPRRQQTEKPNPLPVRISALQALGELKNPAAVPGIKEALDAAPIDPSHPDQENFAIEAAAAIGAIGMPEGEPVLLPLLKSVLPVRNSALVAFAKSLKGNPQSFFRQVDRSSFDVPESTPAWIQAMVELDGEEGRSELKRMLVQTLEQSNAAKQKALPLLLKSVAKARVSGWQNILAPFFGSEDSSLLRAVVDAYQPEADAKEPWAPIVRAYRACSSRDFATRTWILSHLEPWIDEKPVKDLLRSNLEDPELDVRIVSAGLLRKAGETGIRDDLGPANSTVGDALGYAIAAIRKRSTIAMVETSRGNIEIELFREDAPLTAASFALAANRGVYDELQIEKMLPGQWMEGTATRPQTAFRSTIKSEVNMHPFERGSLGMGLADGDSNPGRLFITLSPQPYRDGKYTCFGRVLSGLQIAERLVPGDRIRRIRIKETLSLLNYYQY